ncbi:PD40 domain-containing protein [Intrasporangium oryzae]|uniref:PD40 domain-containing protein n=1 Tax=Intrasporangium oryzae TaxID=412687 RepID=UPI0012F84119|nr:PD40 domain-containing protein [Intrasporangium oryzae]
MSNRVVVPSVDEVASRIRLDRFTPGALANLPAKIPIRIPVPIPPRIHPWLFRDIAYFSYAFPGVAGETTSQEDIFTVGVIGGSIRRVTDDSASGVMKSDRDPAWSPSRTSFAIHTATIADPVSRLVIISAATGAVMQTLVPGHSPEWLDASTLLFLDEVDAGTDDVRTDVFCVDIASHAVTRLTDVGLGASIGGLSWHPAAGLAMSFAREGASPQWSIAVIPAAGVGAARSTGTPVPLSAFTFVTPPTARVAAPAWSPTGDRIALSTWADGSPSRVGFLTVATGAITLVPGPDPSEPTLNDYGAVFSRDGRTIAFTRGEEDEWSEIWLYSVASGHSRQLTDEGRTRFKGALDW